ncbi:MAG: hypothetical protein Kow0062_13220 [Acidobacteriota bacterium]
MIRAIAVRATAAWIVAAALLLPAAAQQDQRIEVEAGFAYPLVGDDFEIAQDPSSFLRIRYNVSPKFQLGVLYERLSTQGDIRPLRFQFVESVPAFDPATGGTVTVPIRSQLGGGGQADLDLWGLTASYVIAGDEDFQLMLVASAGLGDLTFDNPGRAIPLPDKPDNDMDGTPDGSYAFEDIFVSGRQDQTDLDLWYELGAAARWRIGDHWGLRVQATIRSISPDVPNTVLRAGDFQLVPSFGAVLRF